MKCVDSLVKTEKPIRPKVAEKKILCGFSFNLKSSLIKITALWLIAALSWTGLLGVGRTFSYFSDNESSAGDNLRAAALNFHLVAGNWILSDKVANGGSVSQPIDVIKNLGSLDFQYNASTTITGGDADFCGALNLEAKLGGDTKYNDKLVKFKLSPPPPIIIDSGGIDSWTFIVSLPLDPSNPYNQKTCGFKFVFTGWQENFALGGGFSNTGDVPNFLTDPSDTETISIELVSSSADASATDEIGASAQTLVPDQAAGLAPTDLSDSQAPTIDNSAPAIDNNEAASIDSDSAAVSFYVDNSAEQIEEPASRIEIITATQTIIIENAGAFKDAEEADDQAPITDEKTPVLEPAVVPKDNNNEPAVVPVDNSGNGGSGDGGNSSSDTATGNLSSSVESLVTN